MTGLELARSYWEELGRPRLETYYSQILERAAVGLVGEGSECFGFDDEISRDHDWGPGFCLWLTEEDMQRHGDAVRLIYASLPESFRGFRRLNITEETSGRVGVHEIGRFYFHFLGLNRPPETLQEWRMISEHGLAAATNGEIFTDPLGKFSDFRAALLAYYPEDLRRKKLAANCALAAQAGQYNFGRCLRRNEPVAALQALTQFISHIQQIIFLLNRVYRPYYKWAPRKLSALPILGAESARLMERLVLEKEGRSERIEELAALVIGELQRQGLSDRKDDFLLIHASAIQGGIEDRQLRALHLMED